MSSEQIAELIKFGMIIIGAVTAIWKLFDYLGKRDSEKSVGATKVAELMKADEKIRDDIEKLQDNDSLQDGDIETIKNDYKRLMDRIWDYMGNKK